MRAGFAGLAIGLALSVPAMGAGEYRVLERIKVSDGGFDYATFDTAKGRVLMARTDVTTVIDAKTSKVSELKSAGGGHIALPIPGTSLIALAERSGSIRVVDTANDTMVADLPAGKNPDGAAYDPVSKLVYAGNHDGGDVTAVDPIAKKVVATIPVGGVLEFPVSDRAGHVFINVEDKHEIAVIDVKAQTVTARYPLDNCEEPTGLSYIPGAKLLISSCRNNVAKAIHAETGKEAAAIAIAGRPDAVLYDEARKLVLIPCGEGVLEVISAADPAHLTVVQHVPTAMGSRTGTLDPATGRVYLFAAKYGPPPAPGGRAPMLPGTAEVLVVGP